MATSTITAYRSALQAKLAARAGLAGVQISYGMPTGALSREHILFGEVNATQEYRTVGGASGLKYENYDMTVHVGVVREGRQQQQADERALVIMTEIESAIRSDPSCSNTVLVSQLSAYRLEPITSEQSRLTLLTLTITVQARI